MMTSYDNVALWHERDISHSSAERVIISGCYNRIKLHVKSFR